MADQLFLLSGSKSVSGGVGYGEPVVPRRFTVAYQEVKVKLGAVRSTLTITKINTWNKQS